MDKTLDAGATTRGTGMITVYGEGRGFRVVWLLEEMGLAYRLRDVDMMAGVENDPDFLAVNPAGYIPAMIDGDTTIVESVAIMEYLLERHGPSPLAPMPRDPCFGLFKQFMHLGEAGLMMPMYVRFLNRTFGPESERGSWMEDECRDIFESRLGLVARQLERSAYLAGDNFTAADISVTYALEFAQRHGGYRFDLPVSDYISRTSARPGYERAMDSCPATKAWLASLSS